MTLYRHATGLDRKTLESEMGEILTKKGMEHVFSHETFTLEAWLVLLGLINQRCPAFFRMVDRLKQDLEGGREPAMPDLIFEVDMENVVTDKANLFTLFHNLSNKTRTVVFRVQTPNFEPGTWLLPTVLNRVRSIGGPLKRSRSQPKVMKTFSVKCRASSRTVRSLGRHSFQPALAMPPFPSASRKPTVNCCWAPNQRSSPSRVPSMASVHQHLRLLPLWWTGAGGGCHSSPHGPVQRCCGVMAFLRSAIALKW